MFPTPALAQAGPSALAFGGLVEFLLPLVLIFVVFYFLLIRPQQKKARDHRQMVESVRRGDRVITGGGIHGNVTKVGEDGKVTIEIAEDVRVEIVRATLADVVSKTAPVAESGKAKGK